MKRFNNFLSAYYSWIDTEKALNKLVDKINEQDEKIKQLELINKLPETTNGKPKTCKHLEKTGRFKGEPYCQVYKGICKCK